MHPDPFPPAAPPVARAPQPEAAPKRQASGFFNHTAQRLNAAFNRLTDWLIEAADTEREPPTPFIRPASAAFIPHAARHPVEVRLHKHTGELCTIAASVPAWARTETIINETRRALIAADQFNIGDRIISVTIHH